MGDEDSLQRSLSKDRLARLRAALVCGQVGIVVPE
jgi:hypothetical protein